MTNTNQDKSSGINKWGKSFNMQQECYIKNKELCDITEKKLYVCYYKEI